MHVGLIGARGFGRHHLRALENSPHVNAVTLCGRDEVALEALRATCPKVRGIATSHQQLLADPSLDLVDVVVPHDLHLPIALEAFEQGKHVLMEKPPARTMDEFHAMVAASEAAGRRLFVVMNLLYTPMHAAVRQVVDAGVIGRPFFSIEANVGNALHVYGDPDNWRADRERCGGGLQIDGGFHGVYRQLYFLESLGAPQWVTADCAQIGMDEPAKGEDFSALTLAYPCGARVHLCNQWTARATLGRFPSGIVGTEGTLLFTGDENAPLAVRRPNEADESVIVPDGPRGFAESVTACVEHYVECLATGARPNTGLDLAGLTLEITTTAYRAAEEGRRLRITGGFETRRLP
ncbi:MAG: Gfo/Idh/MocA family protein [Actinomycetota bacterium]